VKVVAECIEHSIAVKRCWFPPISVSGEAL